MHDVLRRAQTRGVKYRRRETGGEETARVTAQSVDTGVNRFFEESECCYRTIKDAWEELTVYYNMSDGLPKFQKAYNICEDEEDVETLISNAFIYSSMVDYPTAADFMAPLPAYPINKMCGAIDNHTGNDSLSKVFAALNVYYNYSGTIKCFRNPPRNSHGSEPGWSWQSCTEFFVPQGFDEHSMFPVTKPNVTLISEDCLNNTGVTPRPNWIATEFTVKGMNKVLKRFASNIIFFNGLRDPWSGAGILESISDSLVALVAPEGAHHVDLRFSMKDDPKWLQDIRSQELQIISKWLNEYYNDRNEHNI